MQKIILISYSIFNSITNLGPQNLFLNFLRAKILFYTFIFKFLLQYSINSEFYQNMHKHTIDLKFA